ncbi:MAG: alanine--tRNA ligase [Gemmatimonadota bacterium]
MTAAEIRARFLAYFEGKGHERVASASLVPADDPTLLFTNAGMVQFKRVFLGDERRSYRRAVTAQKCVRAGGKHNDLEQVGVTARHHTFFEMLGNFSFGDYFKRDAIHFGWEFLTSELALDPGRIFVTVHQSDDEAFQLWQEIAGLDASRIFRLGDRDNFWQMADTGPCGPCSELHYDLRPPSAGGVPTREEFEALGDEGSFLELWNLVFMQYDRDAAGELHPLPAPSIDTGAGLERLAAVLQGADSNYHTDLFRPLLDRVADVVGRPYEPQAPSGVSYRVLADHARAVAFLLTDGVFPSNEGRGYVLRRILRRGVRHAWLLDMREPVLTEVVEEVVRTMSDVYPELRDRKDHLLRTTRQEEERFFATIEGGMARFDQVAPVGGSRGGKVISGDEAFRLYDTFGFPLDLTEVMARERGYAVDEAGFETALESQRARSRADRAESGQEMERIAGLQSWTLLDRTAPQAWIGWEAKDAATTVVAVLAEGERVGMILRENPFYAEAGGQVSDRGVVEGAGWRLDVEDVRKVEGRNAIFGRVEGELPGGIGEPFPARASVADGVRHDTERNHTATHLLHAALRGILGEHVTQRGSLVAPDRLRFDFSHPEPLTSLQLAAVEEEVNRRVWEDRGVRWRITSKDEALASGAMALFGEKYGDEVRVVEIPGVSRELCGGTHLRHTGEIGLFTITREGGVAAGVRRIEAVTGPLAYSRLKGAEAELAKLADKLRTTPDAVSRRVDELVAERDSLTGLLAEARIGGGASGTIVHEATVPLANGTTVRYQGVRMRVRDADDARNFGDAFRAEAALAVAALATESPDGKPSLFVFVTDDLVGRGVKAGALVREIAAVAGGRGGGKAHMAQGGVEDPGKVDEALQAGEAVLRQLLAGVAP